MCWCAPTTHRWSLISTIREVCVHAPCTSWRTRSLCGPRINSFRWEQCIFLGISIWEKTSCRGRGQGPGNGCFTPRWWSRYREFLARLKWTSLRLRRHCNVPSGSLWFLQLFWDWMLWCRLGRGFVCTLYDGESAPDGVCQLLVAPFWLGQVWFSDLISLLDGSPWEIPVRRDLLSQAAGTIVHPRPELWKLWVWPLRGHSS